MKDNFFEVGFRIYFERPEQTKEYFIQDSKALITITILLT